MKSTHLFPGPNDLRVLANLAKHGVTAFVMKELNGLDPAVYRAKLDKESMGHLCDVLISLVEKADEEAHDLVMKYLKGFLRGEKDGEEMFMDEKYMDEWNKVYLTLSEKEGCTTFTQRMYSEMKSFDQTRRLYSLMWESDAAAAADNTNNNTTNNNE